MSTPKNVAYVLLHFPYLTETFVAQEIHAIRAKGVTVKIVSLLKPGTGPTQPLSQALLPHTWYAPGPSSTALWLAQIYYLVKSPLLYLSLLLTLLRQPRPQQGFVLLLKRLMIFLKAVATAFYLKNSKIELLHAHFAWLPGAAAWIIARLLDLPFTVTMHAYDIYASNDLLPLVSREADQLVSISDYNRQQVAALGTRSSESISIVHCGVDLTKLEEPLARTNSAGQPIKIISVGSLVAKKGHTHLIEACRLLKQQDLDFFCSIIGAGSGEKALAEQIRKSGLENQVKLWGGRPHPEILQAYQEHDIFALAAVVTPGGDRDGIPVVLMEAGAMGLPLISTEVSGIPELVRHEQTGWVVPPGDARALADAIAKLAADPALRKRLGRNARALVQAEFDIEVNANRLITIFQNIIAPTKSQPSTIGKLWN